MTISTDNNLDNKSIQQTPEKTGLSKYLHIAKSGISNAFKGLAKVSSDKQQIAKEKIQSSSLFKFLFQEIGEGPLSRRRRDLVPLIGLEKPSKRID